MKHKIFSLILTALLVMTLLPGCTIDDRMEAQADLLEDKIEDRFDPAPAYTPTPSAAPAAQITQAQAEEIALNHVGLTADQVQYLHTEFEVDDRIPQYDVQFYSGRTEYEFEIHAENGSILSFDRD